MPPGSYKRRQSDASRGTGWRPILVPIPLYQEQPEMTVAGRTPREMLTQVRPPITIRPTPLNELPLPIQRFELESPAAHQRTGGRQDPWSTPRLLVRIPVS